MQIESKLPNVGVTIFTKMSKMAHEYNAINLAQGFPDFPVSPELIDRVHHYMQEGMNQYAPMPGVPILREAISSKTEHCYGWKPNVDSEITVTCGAIEAINSAVSALIHPGDEVIIMDPAYDAYEPIINLQGAKAIGVPLRQPDYSIDWEGVRSQITSKTKMIMINTPHNPSGATISVKDLSELEQITEGTGIMVLSDEVYEHIVFDGQAHQSVLRSEALRKRSVVTSSFGKTFHATGWRMGYLIAPSELMIEIRKVHQYNTFTIHTATQYAIADYLKDTAHYEDVAPMYQTKRDFFLKVMKGSRFKPVPAKGTYFQLMDYSAISEKGDVEFSEWMTKEIGVATIPMSVFYQDKQDNRVLRFCFAKNENTLAAAAEKLCAL
ncbi:methionine aminotransferase [Roseivirga sp. E12]|uniref:methionine aminotransferase n=1 Tax=Roseivirga sp. E12 TaxID=2819237 RepID=UPI001ABBF1AC|nr:methionine aminotransferase [Roseivirga sp. E12]MBO3700248.1 aminotransferase class I/II-fold pyridoxal phosphate-dependent enzyme [Roseivirga sp. E12]